MKHEIETNQFLRQMKMAKKLSLELAVKESLADADKTKEASEMPVSSPTKLTPPPKAKMPPIVARRRSIANSSRHSRSSRRFLLESSSLATSPTQTAAKSQESATYVGLQRFVDVEVDGHHGRINVFDRLEVVSPRDLLLSNNGPEKEESEKENTPKKCESKRNKCSDKCNEDRIASPSGKLKQPSFRVVENYYEPPRLETARPDGYYRFIEKTSEELEDEIEYEMDCEDLVWFRLYNEHRQKLRQCLISEDTFETLMNSLEKEAYVVSQTTMPSASESIAAEDDDDIVCAVCLDDECQNSNVILFCDSCNLAVHQDCYGVPYVPEGQWLCSRCQVSPNSYVSCCLCPLKDGAMKQTNDGGWAHILCALWVPEVGFGNIESLEPITKIDKVPNARRKLTCSVCKKKGIGASIQCMKKNCYTAFHVSCAQQIGLYMKIEPAQNENGVLLNVQKTILCDQHKPADAKPFQPMYAGNMDSDDDRPTTTTTITTPSANKKNLKSPTSKARARMEQLRSEHNRNATPVRDVVGVISNDRLVYIMSSLKMKDKISIMESVYNYWRMKRNSRNGVPLLRRLQAATLNLTTGKSGVNSECLTYLAGLKHLKKLRQEMEKVRLLLELVRKREKLKLEEIKLHQTSLMLELEPFNIFLRETLTQLQEKDRSGIFAYPVPLIELPDYSSVISNPMDFSTMREKIDGHAYRMFDDFEADFQLIINNCLTFNAKHSLYYKAALRIRHQADEILVQARQTADEAGFCALSGLYRSAVEIRLEVPEPFSLFLSVTELSKVEIPFKKVVSPNEKVNKLCESRRSSNRVKTVTRRYLIDDDISHVSCETVLRKRRMSTDSEEPPVLSRCPSPTDDDEAPVLPTRKRSRLANSRADPGPPQLVKSDLISSDDAFPVGCQDDLSPRNRGILVEKEAKIPVSGIGRNEAPADDDSLIDTAEHGPNVTSSSTMCHPKILTDGHPESFEENHRLENKDEEEDGCLRSSQVVAVTADVTDTAASRSSGTVVCDDVSSPLDPFPADHLSTRSDVFDHLGSLQIDSAYGSCSNSSDSDNSEKL